MFINIAQGSVDVVRPWLYALRNVEFAIFVKLKIDDGSHRLAHIKQWYNEGLAELVVSAYGQAFRQTLERIAHSGIDVQMIGFREHTSLGASVGYLRVRRPGGHRGYFPRAIAANQPRCAVCTRNVARAISSRWLRY
ncbi:NYN domain-containing protein [Mycobacterium lepromatosis]|nr:NYN domain-containing protein [Mycobacterium lepromatosis]